MKDVIEMFLRAAIIQAQVEGRIYVSERGTYMYSWAADLERMRRKVFAEPATIVWN